jgi:hypothetical protein
MRPVESQQAIGVELSHGRAHHDRNALQAGHHPRSVTHERLLILRIVSGRGVARVDEEANVGSVETIEQLLNREARAFDGLLR